MKKTVGITNAGVVSGSGVTTKAPTKATPKLAPKIDKPVEDIAAELKAAANIEAPKRGIGRLFGSSRKSPDESPSEF